MGGSSGTMGQEQLCTATGISFKAILQQNQTNNTSPIAWYPAQMSPYQENLAKENLAAQSNFPTIDFPKSAIDSMQ